MIRAKPPKKKQSVDQKLLRYEIKKRTDHIYETVNKEISEKTLKIIMLACKDEFWLSDEKLEKLYNRIERYLNMVGDHEVSLEQVDGFLDGE